MPFSHCQQLPVRLLIAATFAAMAAALACAGPAAGEVIDGAAAGGEAVGSPVAAAPSAAPEGESNAPAEETVSPEAESAQAPSGGGEAVEATEAKIASTAETAAPSPPPASPPSEPSAPPPAPQPPSGGSVRATPAEVAPSAADQPVGEHGGAPAAIGQRTSQLAGAARQAAPPAVERTVEQAAWAVGGEEVLASAHGALRDVSATALLTVMTAPLRELLEREIFGSALLYTQPAEGRLPFEVGPVSAGLPPVAAELGGGSGARLAASLAAATPLSAAGAAGSEGRLFAPYSARGATESSPAGSPNGAAETGGPSPTMPAASRGIATGSSPNSPSPPPSQPSQAVFSGSGGPSFFVPLAALLALLALAAPATFRRLGELELPAPSPFVCALERPG